MRYVPFLAILLFAGCTVVNGAVTDVTPKDDGTLIVRKCDVKAYLAFYGLIAATENCRNEIKPVPTVRATH